MKQRTLLSLAALLGVAVLAVMLILLRPRPGQIPSARRPAVEAPANTQVFTVTGTVRSADPNSGIVRVAHEEIPGYMEAMTMPFLSRDTAGIRNLRPGDRIAFNLVVTADDSWITGIQKLRPAVGASFAETAAHTRAEREANRVQTGEKVPDFTLTNHHGDEFNLSGWAGKAVIVNFIYTSCPLPNFCPLLAKKTVELQERLQTEFEGFFQLVSVTMDPERDTPEVLAAYGRRFSTNLTTWALATGSPDQIRQVAEYFGLIYERKGALIDHDLRTALVGPDGRLVHIWRSNEWTPYEVRNRVEECLGEKTRAAKR